MAVDRVVAQVEDAIFIPFDRYRIIGPIAYARGRGRPVDAPPWKRHLPPAPVPASLQPSPLWREVAVHLGKAASAARAFCIGVIGIAPWGNC